MHLSDLHLGKSIMEESLIDDQRYILNEIIEIVNNKKVDVVLIAGDVYDKAIPSVEAVRLFSEFLSRLYKMNIKVFVIAGNHDSKDRLSFGNELFVDNGIYIEGVFNGSLRSVELEDDNGKILIYMLPFIKPYDVKGFYSDVEINSYNDAVKVIIDNTKIDKSVRNVIMVHQFVTAKGVEFDDSEVEALSLGGIDNVDVSLFDDFDYVAMGHIHRGQRLLKDNVRYAGSPLKYSFSEVNHKKSVSIIDIGKKGNIDIEYVDLVPLRDMRVIKGKLDNLLSDDVVRLGNVDDYICAIITDDDYVMDVIGKLRSVYKNVLKVEYQNKRSLSNNNVMNVIDVDKKSEIELFNEFYLKQNNIEMDEERLDIVNNVIRECLEEKL